MHRVVKIQKALQVLEVVGLFDLLHAGVGKLDTVFAGQFEKPRSAQAAIDMQVQLHLRHGRQPLRYGPVIVSHDVSFHPRRCS